MIVMDFKKVNYIEEVKTDSLKILACILMLIDHIGFVIDNIYLRALGRLSFPIFAYLLVLGNTRTSNKLKYALRLIIFALISQIPYSLYFHTSKLNIFVTLALGLLMLNINFEDIRKTIIAEIILLVILGLINEIMPYDYGLYGLLVFIIFKWYLDVRVNFIMFTLITLTYCIFYNSYIQLFSILALPIIYFMPVIEKKLNLSFRLNKYIFYAFYPVHLIVLKLNL